jgi:hypothetical protein
MEPIVIDGYQKTSVYRSLEAIIHRQFKKFVNDPQSLGHEFESLAAYRFLKYFEAPKNVENFELLPIFIVEKYRQRKIRIRIPNSNLSILSQPLNSEGTWLGTFLEVGYAPFGFPDIHTGPDLIFSLEVLNSFDEVVSRILVLVQVCILF